MSVDCRGARPVSLVADRRVGEGEVAHRPVAEPVVAPGREELAHPAQRESCHAIVGELEVASCRTMCSDPSNERYRRMGPRVTARFHAGGLCRFARVRPRHPPLFSRRSAAVTRGGSVQVVAGRAVRTHSAKRSGRLAGSTGLSPGWSLRAETMRRRGPMLTPPYPAEASRRSVLSSAERTRACRSFRPEASVRQRAAALLVARERSHAMDVTALGVERSRPPLTRAGLGRSRALAV